MANKSYVYTDSLGWKQNNWGNLRGEGVNWKGKIGMSNGFSVFDKPINGVRAIFIDLSVKLSKNVNTIEKIISMYAPEGDGNDTEEYIRFVSNEAQIIRTQPLNVTNLPKVVRAIIKKEIGYNIPDQMLKEAYTLAFSPQKTNSSGGFFTFVPFIIIAFILFILFNN